MVRLKRKKLGYEKRSSSSLLQFMVYLYDILCLSFHIFNSRSTQTYQTKSYSYEFNQFSCLQISKLRDRGSYLSRLSEGMWLLKFEILFYLTGYIAQRRRAYAKIICDKVCLDVFREKFCACILITANKMHMSYSKKGISGVAKNTKTRYMLSTLSRKFAFRLWKTNVQIEF